MTPRKLAPYVLRALAQHQLEGEMVTLQTLVDQIGVRRADVRRTVSSLHREGYVDALRMRLTLPGFSLGLPLLRIELPPLRRAAVACAAA